MKTAIPKAHKDVLDSSTQVEIQIYLKKRIKDPIEIYYSQGMD